MKSTYITILLFLASGALLLLVGLDIAGFPILGDLPDIVQILNLPSVLLVLGGVLLATAISHPPDVIRQGLPYLARILSHSEFTPDSRTVDVTRVLEWQHRMRSNRIKTRAELALELEHSFEGYLFGLASTNYSVDDIRRLGEAKLRHRSDQLNRCADMFGDMSRFAPAFGMLGTLIGLIQMLGTFDSISELGQGLSFALMTTMYGIILAYTLLGPLESKIRNLAMAVESRDRLMLDGILLIQEGVAPLMVYDTLMARQSGLGIDSLPDALDGGPIG